MGKSSCLTILALSFAVYALITVQDNPVPLIAVGVLAVAGAVLYLLSIRTRKSNDLVRLQNIAALLEGLSKNITDKKTSDIAGFAAEKGETPIYKLSNVALTEYRSTGSSYSGGSQGVSIRIAKGLSYRVGSNKGQLLRNPEQLTVIDNGSAIFTDQRIVFVGSNVNREWELNKLLDVNVGTNGVFVNMAVSNRQKNSGLQSTDTSDITPGLLAAIAIEAHNKGFKGASDIADQYITEMKGLLALEEPKN